MKWLHCNKCGITKILNRRTEFHCGSCSHIFCDKCNRLQACPIDKLPFQGIKIEGSMPSKLRCYFEDPNNLLIRWHKCIRFQYEQKSRYEELELTRNLKQMRQLKEEIKLLTRAQEVLTESIQKDVKRNNKMKSYLKYCLQSNSKLQSSSLELSRASTSLTSLNFSSGHGESGVDLQFDELDISN